MNGYGIPKTVGIFAASVEQLRLEGRWVKDIVLDVYGRNMAEGKKGGGGNRKHGRNIKKCAAYRLHKTSERHTKKRTK